MTQVMQANAVQPGLVPDPVPGDGDGADRPGRRPAGEHERAAVAVARGRVDDLSRGARHPDRARCRLRVGQLDAPVPDPVPQQARHLAGTAAGEQQQADHGDHILAPKLIGGEDGVELAYPSIRTPLDVAVRGIYAYAEYMRLPNGGRAYFSNPFLF